MGVDSERFTPDYGRLFGALPGVYWLCGSDGSCSYAGPQLSALTGMPEHDLLGFGWKRAVHPADRAELDAALDQQEEFSVELRLARDDGEYCSLIVRGVPHFEGRLATEERLARTWLLAGSEVEPKSTRASHHRRNLASKRSKAEQLVTSEERYRLVNKATHDVVWDWDLVAGQLSWNDAVEATFGYSPGEIPPDLAWWSERVHPDDRARVHEELERALGATTTQHWSSEYRFQHVDGRWLSVLDRGYIARDAEGRPLRMIGSMIDVTLRERAQEALRQSEEQFRLLANAIPQLVWTMRADGVPEYLNDQWYEYTGSSAEAARGELWSRMLHPDDVDRTLERWQNSARTGEPYEVEYRLRRGADGTYRWFLNRAVPMRDPEGHIVRWFGASTDIEDRKRAEAALEEAKNRLEVILASLPVGVFISDAEGTIREMNAYARELWGGAQPPLRLGECQIHGFLPEDGHPLTRDEYALARALFQGEKVEGEIIEIEHPATGRRTILTNAAPFRDGAGRITGAVSVVVDITDWKRVEAALRESETRARDEYADLEQIYRYAPVGLFTLDREYRFLRVNEHIAEMNGIPAREHIGKRLEEVLPDLASHLREVFRPVLDRGKAVLEAEVRGVTPRAPGLHRDWLGSYYPLRSTSGEVVGLIGAVLEVTARKQAERALRESEERLREADRHKNEFLGMLSHELRNPLAPIRSSVFILDHLELGGEQARRAVQVLQRQVSHLTRLVDDLLDVTRISRGKIHLQIETIDLNDVVLSTGEDVRECFARNGVEFQFTLSPEPLRMQADRTRIAQVLDNLLQNAAKFTPSGGRAELSVRRAGDEQAIVEVRDYGAGIDPGLVGKLFEPFVQADKTLDRTRGGLGLGLALVKGLTELHGGSVSVESEGVGKGALFSVRLPVEPPARATEHAPSPAVTSANSHAHSRRVLIVEDNQDAALSLRDALELSGHAADVAFSGTEGIKKAHEMLPEVVVCDIGLPEVDGYGVAKALRGDPEMRSAYLIALSGYAQPEDTEKSKQAGFDRHLAKPANLDALEQLLAEAPEPTAQRSASPAPEAPAPSLPA